jgi:DNA-binding transcriptional regulator LsrR (DeoR family)
MASGNGTGSGGGRRKKNRGIAQNEELRIRALLERYFPGGVAGCESEREVARRLGLTPQAVSALNQASSENGEFSVLIRLPRERVDVVRLEEAVRARYPQLKKVLLVPGLPQILEDIDQRRRRSLHTHAILAMAQRVAEHLDALVAHAGACQRAVAQAGKSFEALVIGVAWGRTMNLLAEHLLSTPREHRLLGLQVLPIVGITSSLKADPVEANIVAMNIARAFGGRAAQLPCPAFLPAHEAEIVSEIHPVKRMLERIRKANVVITSMGPIPENVSYTDITLSNDPEMSRRLFDMAREAGAIGEICYWLFDRNGREVTTAHKGIGLGFDGLRDIAKRGEVILLSGGDKWRFEPLRVALEAGLASVLVSDTVTARYLVGELQASMAAGVRAR